MSRRWAGMDHEVRRVLTEVLHVLHGAALTGLGAVQGSRESARRVRRARVYADMEDPAQMSPMVRSRTAGPFQLPVDSLQVVV